MRPHPAALLTTTLLLAALLSGCTDGGSTTSTDDQPQVAGFTQEQFQGDATQGTPASGSASSHGEPQREDGPVTTGSDPTQVFSAWARRTVTITNDFGGADLGLVTLSVQAGLIEVTPVDDPNAGYDLVIDLEARAETEQQARDALDLLKVNHDDSLESDGLHLSTQVRYDDTAGNPTPFPLPNFQLWNGVQTTADLRMTVPAGPAYDLWASASSGDVSVQDLRGPRFRLDTSSGDVTAKGLNAGEMAVSASSGDLTLETLRAALLSADTSSGGITAKTLDVDAASFSASSGDLEIAGRFGDLAADTSSGLIHATAEPTRTGTWTFDASSGDLTVEVAIAATLGYDVSAEVSSGSIDIDLPDTTVLDEDEDGDSKHVQSIGFDGLPIQTTMTLDASSGDITVLALGADAGIL